MASTWATTSSTLMPSGMVTVACSVAYLTLASTPSSLLSRLVMRAAHDAQVIPPMSRATVVLVGLVVTDISVLHVGGAGDGTLVEGERGGAHDPVVLEVEEQGVAAGGRQLGVEPDHAGLVAVVV